MKSVSSLKRPHVTKNTVGCQKGQVGLRQLECSFDRGVLRSVRTEFGEIIGEAIGNHSDTETRQLAEHRGK